jgi:hypothetical protein
VLSAFKIDGRQEGIDKLLTRSNKLNLTRNLNSKIMFCKRDGQLKIRNPDICVVNIVVLNTSSIQILRVKFSDTGGGGGG